MYTRIAYKDKEKEVVGESSSLRLVICMQSCSQTEAVVFKWQYMFSHFRPSYFSWQSFTRLLLLTCCQDEYHATVKFVISFCFFLLSLFLSHSPHFLAVFSHKEMPKFSLLLLCFSVLPLKSVNSRRLINAMNAFRTRYKQTDKEGRETRVREENPGWKRQVTASLQSFNTVIWGSSFGDQWLMHVIDGIFTGLEEDVRVCSSTGIYHHPRRQHAIHVMERLLKTFYRSIFQEDSF